MPNIERNTPEDVWFTVYEFGTPTPIGSVVVSVRPTESGSNVCRRALGVARQKYQGHKGITVRQVDERARTRTISP